MPCLQCPANRLHDLFEPAERNRARINALAPGGFLAQLGNVHISEIGQHQRARDRCRRHHQNVDGLALAGKRQSLVHTEPVLFVDDGEPKVAKLDLFLEQRMSPDKDVDFAERELGKNGAAFPPALATSENGDIDTRRGGERRNRIEMLARQDLRRRHECGLPPAFYDRCRGKHRDDGFARPYIALQQPQHALGLGEIGNNLGDGTRLRKRKRIGKGLDQFLSQVSGSGRGAAGRPPHMRAYQCQGQLTCKQLVVSKSRPRGCFRGNVVRLGWAVQRRDRIAKRGKPLAGDPAWVLPLRQIGHTGECSHHSLAHNIQA